MSNTTNNQTHDRKKQPSDEKKASLTLNFVMNAILTMSQFLFPLITFPYISRILLPTGTGKVSFATSVVSYFALFAQLGIPTYGIRACAKVRDDRKALERTVQELFLINLIMSILAYIVLFLGNRICAAYASGKSIIFNCRIDNSFQCDWHGMAIQGT